jgi:hypothetical protein
MILLADWANFRNSGATVQPDEQDVAVQEDECGVTDIILLLVDDLQVASRHQQAVKSRSDVQAKLDSLTNQVTELLQTDVAALRLVLDRQLKALFLPLLSDKLEAKAIEDFCNALLAAVGKDAGRNLVISAPPELHDRLASRLGQFASNANIIPNDGQEIAVSLEATEITTEIGKWKADLQRLLS